MKASFFDTVLSIVKSEPNNMKLGAIIREFIDKKVLADNEAKTQQIIKSQITIFDDLNNYENRS